MAADVCAQLLDYHMGTVIAMEHVKHTHKIYATISGKFVIPYL
jgi:hypothetical protein